ncbi:autotransporter outer membrane beta-barrel domain-containing protein [Pantoea sp. BAV 3049]|uniref:autotransporter outer membrane beta-barrel domain-containing protein n=1 Tax=Pantoea sp. BAV 3049 TaxID=2654188 RepID=UPI00131ACAD7|nr:autotransporter outer membrane beta-barrel domain-containing protein [Pantoea sp. BAV 3049]
MMALGQQFATGLGKLTATWGMARLTGNGGNHSTRAGDNGLTGGYGQFMGLSHSLPLTADTNWDNSLRYDQYQLESRRHLNFAGVNRVASTSGSQQYLEFRSQGTKQFELNEGVTLAPYAGMKMRHYTFDGYSEHGAGDFNLTMSRDSETAVDAVAGMKLDYAGDHGCAASLRLEAGPNLSSHATQAQASLQGLSGRRFNVDNNRKSGDLNGQAVAGVNYQQHNTTMGFNAYQWKEDSASDKGFMLNVSRSF